MLSFLQGAEEIGVESMVEVTQRSSPFYGRKGKVLDINHRDGTAEVLLEEVRTATKQLAFDGGATKPDEEEEEASNGEKVDLGSVLLPELQKAIKLGALVLQSELEKLRYAAFSVLSSPPLSFPSLPFPFLSFPFLSLPAFACKQHSDSHLCSV